MSALLGSIRGYLLLIANQELDREIRVKVAPSDLVQDVLIKAQANLPGFRGTTRDALLAWLRKMMRNEIVSARRHYRAGIRDVQREVRRDSNSKPLRLKSEKRSPQSSFIQSEEVEIVRAAVSKLSEEYRTVIFLRTWRQLPFHDVGQRMNRSAEAAKKLWQRAILSLRKKLDDDF